MKDFLLWGFSEIRANTLRGVFAEWLVGTLLADVDLSQQPRDPWFGRDLTSRRGVTIEVKCSSTLHTYAPRTGRERAILFSNLKTRPLDPVHGIAGEPRFHADLYVFCIHSYADQERWSAEHMLDLANWQFYLLERRHLEREHPRNSIGLKSLHALAARHRLGPFDTRQFIDVATSKLRHMKPTRV